MLRSMTEASLFAHVRWHVNNTNVWCANRLIYNSKHLGQHPPCLARRLSRLISLLTFNILDAVMVYILKWWPGSCQSRRVRHTCTELHTQISFTHTLTKHSTTYPNVRDLTNLKLSHILSAAFYSPSLQSLFSKQSLGHVGGINYDGESTWHNWN